jgi:predicted nuclease with TOPRIM domain
MMAGTNIEKTNLEAHVELCAERYSALESKLGNLEQKVEKLEEHVVFIRDRLTTEPNQANKTLITIGTTLMGALITGIIVILVNFINK